MSEAGDIKERLADIEQEITAHNRAMIVPGSPAGTEPLVRRVLVLVDETATGSGWDTSQLYEAAWRVSEMLSDPKRVPVLALPIDMALKLLEFPAAGFMPNEWGAGPQVVYYHPEKAKGTS